MMKFQLYLCFAFASFFGKSGLLIFVICPYFAISPFVPLAFGKSNMAGLWINYVFPGPFLIIMANYFPEWEVIKETLQVEIFFFIWAEN